MKTILLYLVLLIPAILIGQEESPSDEVNFETVSGKLKLGQDFEIRGATVSLLKVISDSRCPRKVTCIWPGEARILIGIRLKGSYLEREIIISNGAATNIGALGIASFNLDLTYLSPYPETGIPIDPQAYHIGYVASFPAED